jgi:DNA-binding response OmpR family regulator
MMPRQPDAAPPRLLVVDDEADIVEYLCTALEDNGFVAAGASDPALVPVLVRQIKPDAILLDILMPGQSGLALYRTLRQDPAAAAIPVIIVTGVSRSDGLPAEVGSLSPPDGFLEKPIAVPRLVETVRHVLRRRGEGRHA